MRLHLLVIVIAAAACTGKTSPTQQDFAFDGTCVNCHAGMSAGHSHPNYKLRCVDCHGGDDQVAVPAPVPTDAVELGKLLALAHVRPAPELAHFFYANGIDDDGDGVVDNGPVFDAGRTHVDFGENFEPQLHGEGGGEFFDTELNRDLNYTRWLNPGDLRVATISCGSGSRASRDGGGGCHQQTIDIVRRGIMANQAAVTNGAYYGNESWRPDFFMARDVDNPTGDPRSGAFGYALDYDGADGCIDQTNVDADTRANGLGGRVQPTFDPACLQARATAQDAAHVGAGAPGNAGLPAFEIAEGTIRPTTGTSPATPDQTLLVTGAGDLRLPWGGQPSTSDARSALAPLLDDVIRGPDGSPLPDLQPDPVDLILRTFRAYYPMNYPGSTTNFTFTFGTSILPEQARFVTNDPYGRGHSSGCSACHAPYAYDGARRPTRVRQPDGTFVDVVDPTTKAREFDPATDRATVNGQDRLVGRIVNQAQQDAGRNGVPSPQQRTFTANHQLTTKIDTDTCGLCHGFVTRINYAYQGMAEEEQRDALARRKPIDFTTPAGTQVRILDSWVREDNDVDGDGVRDAAPTVVVPEGTAVVALAVQRDATLAAQGLVAGAGGCAQAVFTEDCNNNGELDHALVLERKDEDGRVIASATIDEDLNANGTLDLIDRLPRERSIDGRQVRYVYGGRNGSTRQMDIHFERGMHCIDCHFLQDVHGDGHVYSTNWDAIEIECEDCHGSGSAKATLVTSGPNGGNDLTRAVDDDHRPFFARKGGAIIQRSRVNPGVFWQVPQTVDVTGGDAREGHRPEHVAEPKQGSTFEGAQGTSKMTSAKLECAACHGSWVLNCVGCHVEVNVGDAQRDFVDAAGDITKQAGENEVWLSNKNNRGHINFQLLGLLRSPFVLGAASTSERGRLAPFRSSMEAHVSVSDANRELIRDNLTLTTFQAVDGNSGRTNVATSGVVMNQTMPHTVRPLEARGCETCHTLVDQDGRARNEAIMAETFGLGTGSIPFLGDWVFAAGTAGITGTGALELFEYKQENELGANLKPVPAVHQRFPGLIVDGASRTPAHVEPLEPGVAATDVLLVRNFNPTPAMPGTTAPPTLTDVAVLAVGAEVQLVDVSLRGHSTAVRPAAGAVASVAVTGGPIAGLAHLGSDVSDPFVYAATAAGLSVIRLDAAPGSTAVTGREVGTLPLAGKTTTRLALAGDKLYAGTRQGTIEVISVADPTAPAAMFTLELPHGPGVDDIPVVNDVAVSGFLLYVATSAGTTVLALDDVDHPGPPAGATAITYVGPPAQGLSVSGGKAYVAAGTAGVVELDFRTPATPVVGAELVAMLAPGQPVNAVDVVLSQLPGQMWLMVLDADGGLLGLKLDGARGRQERCYPDPIAAGCALDVALRDITRSGRDPSFDPASGTFDSVIVDPSAPTFFRQPAQILGGGTRLARPVLWEQINTLTGRRYRDSFMPGAGTISLEVMQKMRAVTVCETATPGSDPTGLDELGYPVAGQPCTPFGVSARPDPVCRPDDAGGAAAGGMSLLPRGGP